LLGGSFGRTTVQDFTESASGSLGEQSD